MKNINFILLLFIALISLSTVSSCKKDENVKFPTNELVKTESIDTKNISNSETSRDNLTQNAATRLVTNSSEITKTITLTPPAPGNNPSVNNPSLISPAYVSPNIMFVATVKLANGFANVTLNSYMESSGSTTIRATVLGIYTDGNVVHFSVNYQYYTDGTWSGSSHGDYAVAM